ncbi:hypothetical protein [Paraburkholderia flagellata]|uniref:hypothetical protein n=1 Tax=Paraburkholderia flagellata TaxID=2883241 RepID=UPI001F35955B|nr:hypothetical protein [Paraburkholderia flagellata]
MFPRTMPMICAENQIGGEDDTQGFKLNQQVMLTENACASLIGCAFETESL